MCRTTILVKSFNRPELVADAVESCISQSVRCQILIIDDGSEPAVADAVAKLASRAQNIEVLNLRENFGPSHVNNVAVSHVCTEFLAFLDSDDLLDQRFVEHMEAALDEHPWADFAYCRFVGGPKWNLSGPTVFSDVLQQGYLSALGTLMGRVTAFKNLSPLPTRIELGRAADACDDDRLSFEAARSYGVVHVPEELYHYREVIDNRLTKDSNLMIEAWTKFYRDYREDYQSSSTMWLFGRNLLRALEPHRPDLTQLKHALAEALGMAPDPVSRMEAAIAFWFELCIKRSQKLHRKLSRAAHITLTRSARRLSFGGLAPNLKK